MCRSSSSLVLVLIAVGGCFAPPVEVTCQVFGLDQARPGSQVSALVGVTAEQMVWVWCAGPSCHAELHDLRSGRRWERAVGATTLPPDAGHPDYLQVVGNEERVFVGVLRPVGEWSAHVVLEAVSAADGALVAATDWWLHLQEFRIVLAPRAEGVVVAQDSNYVLEGPAVQPHGWFELLDGALLTSAVLSYPNNTKLHPVASTALDSTLLLSLDGRVVRRVRFSDPPSLEDVTSAPPILESSSPLERLAAARDVSLVAAATASRVVVSNGAVVDGAALDLAIDALGSDAVLVVQDSSGLRLLGFTNGSTTAQRLGTIEGATGPSVVMEARGAFTLAYQREGTAHLRRYRCSGLQ